MRRSLIALAVSFVLASCGARSSLDGVDAGRMDAGAARFDGGRRDSGLARDAGRARDAGSDAGSDAGPDAGPERCRLEVSGEPTVVYRRGAHGEGLSQPTPVVLGPDRIALVMQHEHFWHSDVRVVGLRLGADWPDAIEETDPMVRWGIDAHSFHVVTREPGSRMTLSHFQGDLAAGRPQGTVAVPFDLGTWTVEPAEFLGEAVSFSYSISASGDGSFVTYLVRQEDNTRELWLARIDASGAPVGEPMLITENREGPFGAFTDVLDDGAVLVAQNGADGTRFGRIDWDRRSYTSGGLVPLLEGRRARSPTLRVGDGEGWAVWREEVAGDPEQEYVVRVARLDSAGAVLEQPVEEQLPLTQGPSLVAGNDGAVVLLAMRGSDGVMPGELGAGTLRLIRARGDGDVQTLDLPTTRLRYQRAVEAAWLSPRTLIVAMSAYDSESSMDAIHLARFDCILE